MQYTTQEQFKLFRLIGQIRHQIRRAVNVRLAHVPSLSLEMVELLMVLGDNKVASQQEIAVLTLKDKASISRIINKLIAYGLVSLLTNHTKDQRIKLLKLTTKGNQVYHLLTDTVNEVYKLTKQQLSSGEYHLLTELLMRLTIQLDLSTQGISLKTNEANESRS